MIVGGGGVGTMAAYNLEAGGLAETTMILRSNYDVVSRQGFRIDSCQHGEIHAWKPRGGILAHIDRTGSIKFDYVICSTKNIPDGPGPTVAQLVKPYVTPGHTAIVLIQNGINIETPLIAAFPHNAVLSGISLIGVIEPEPGHIVHNDADKLMVGYFPNPGLPDHATQEKAARDFIRLYSASAKVEASYDADVPWTRWRKLLYNAVYNPLSALTDSDTSRLRLSARQDQRDPSQSHNVLDHLILPAMREIQAAARAVHQVELPDALLESVVEADSIAEFLLPSMQQDVQKGRFVECEVILGETVRLGEGAGVQMPVVRTLYCMCRAVQFRAKERAGLLDVKELAAKYHE
ncbi:ketopantoate reductase PanE/ApbA-domain-containing protein [Microdochium trichocladiopsis]|uniref:Ketopantoate reductase PanE/ApbA-domain-containing protein n=1 Tax=Microdochium trichocladiopsis TaxID=1682393 RepID=A0A9P9BI86_9PEZI|nr:ketopantoate reductase PanE/ApbA-domain-containing protein [Microdochium trichocladiopsis]KAH7014115.1 ketopantoate reductase PanE/ApbA-domain-containing protein [Microdochium trichocladiopsis]